MWCLLWPQGFCNLGKWFYLSKQYVQVFRGRIWTVLICARSSWQKSVLLVKIDNVKQTTNYKAGGLRNGNAGVYICDSRHGVK